MAEELEEAGLQAGGASADPAAMALALGGASRAKADAFLDDQRGLIADQRHHMRIQLRQLHLGVAEKWLGVLLRVATAFVGIAVAAALAWLVWNAASSNDLVIDSFQVPPDLAAQGLSGPVIAAKLSDRIAAMQAQTVSQRAAKSYANGISDGLKLEIPETGVSLAELDRFLREKLGHDVHISGEMVQAGNAIALTARVGTDGIPTVSGTPDQIETLLQQLAERIYRITQPYRFAVWLEAHDRAEEGIGVLKELVANGNPNERAWAFNGWAVATIQRRGERSGLALLKRGLAADPNNYLLDANLATAEHRLGRDEDATRDAAKAEAAAKAHGMNYTVPERIDSVTRSYRAILAAQQGDFQQAVQQDQQAAPGAPGIRVFLVDYMALLHQLGAAGAVTLETPANVANTGTYAAAAFMARMAIAVEGQDWPAVFAIDRDFTAFVRQYPGFAESTAVAIDSPVALALAHKGQFTAAEARLKNAPADCYPCLIARGQVAALARQDGRADYWFARAVATGPSLPFAETAWGQALLARGRPDDAVAKFTLANRKGPHFADPLEGWGEALMAENQSHLALAKFAQAEKYAPNWGRLHLKWGEALAYAGKRAEARKEFARAAALDLTPSEKTELAERNHG